MTDQANNMVPQKAGQKPIKQFHQQSAIQTLCDRCGVEPTRLFQNSLRSVAFQDPNVTDEQLLALCLVANQHGLNPFTRELYAFPSKKGGIVPIISVDGWFRIMNEHPFYEGLQYVEDEDDGGLYGECTMYHSKRRFPTIVREYLVENRRNTDVWRMHPRRMLRHRTIIQAARLCFGLGSGAFEPSEGEEIALRQNTVTAEPVDVPVSTRGSDRLADMMQRKPTHVGSGSLAGLTMVGSSNYPVSAIIYDQTAETTCEGFNEGETPPSAPESPPEKPESEPDAKPSRRRKKPVTGGLLGEDAPSEAPAPTSDDLFDDEVQRDFERSIREEIETDDERIDESENGEPIDEADDDNEGLPL